MHSLLFKISLMHFLALHTLSQGKLLDYASHGQMESESRTFNSLLTWCGLLAMNLLGTRLCLYSVIYLSYHTRYMIDLVKELDFKLYSLTWVNLDHAEKI